MKEGFYVTTQNPDSIVHSAEPRSDQIPASLTEPLTNEERERLLEHYRSMNFKEFLAACPIDGIDLTREPEHPREVKL